jgi:hypothetical protein
MNVASAETSNLPAEAASAGAGAANSAAETANLPAEAKVISRFTPDVVSLTVFQGTFVLPPRLQEMIEHLRQHENEEKMAAIVSGIP